MLCGVIPWHAWVRRQPTECWVSLSTNWVLEAMSGHQAWWQDFDPLTRLIDPVINFITLYYFCLFLCEFNSANIFEVLLGYSYTTGVDCSWDVVSVTMSIRLLLDSVFLHRSHFCLNLCVLLVCPYNSDGLVLSPSSSSICTHFFAFYSVLIQ